MDMEDLHALIYGTSQPAAPAGPAAEPLAAISSPFTRTEETHDSAPPRSSRNPVGLQEDVGSSPTTTTETTAAATPLHASNGRFDRHRGRLLTLYGAHAMTDADGVATHRTTTIRTMNPTAATTTVTPAAIPSQPPNDTTAPSSHRRTRPRTAEQEEARQARLQRRAERVLRQRKWKRRKYNLTQEEDVGGAVAHAIRMALQNQRASSRGAGNTENKDGEEDGAQDYWQQGLTAPRQVEINYAHLPVVPLANTTTTITTTLRQTCAGQPPPTQSAATSGSVPQLRTGTHPHATDQATSVPLLTLRNLTMNATRNPLLDPNLDTFRLWPTPSDPPVRIRRMHRRWLGAVTARALYAGAGEGSAAEAEAHRRMNRLLQLLWKPPPLKDTCISSIGIHHVDVQTLGQHQVEWRASHWKFFLEHRREWGSHQERVARELGLDDTRGYGVPPSLVGIVLGERKYMNKLNDRLQQRMLQQYATKTTRAKEMVQGTGNGSEETQYSALAPTVGYYYVPGSVPPTPMGPLDITGVVFGPMDRYNQALQSAPMTETIFCITLATLMSRLLAARFQGDAFESVSVQQQIHCMVLDAVKANHTNLWKLIAMHPSRTVKEIPLPQFAKIVEGYCSLVANGILPATACSYDNDSDDNDDTNDDDDSGCKEIYGSNGRFKSFLRPGETTESVFDLIEQWKDENGLQTFSNLQVTFGLFRIAQVLPDVAVDMFSAPLDSTTCRTPMERIQQVLEFMEASHMLVSVEVPLIGKEHNVIHVVELEFAFHKACECFAKAMERDPAEPSHYGWYIAALAGSLLLCSGNRIRSEARLYPSYRANENTEQSLFGSMQDRNEVASHEVRRKLPKFETLRRQTAQALQLLVTLAEQQRGLRSNLLVASCLEWRQLMALLVGPHAGHHDDFLSIQSLHHHYAAQWAIQENSKASLEYLQRHTDMASDDKLSGLATQLETDPSTDEHWIRFVEGLAAYGIGPRRDDTAWWGHARQDWWDYMLLHIPLDDNDTIDEVKLAKACRAWKRSIEPESMTNGDSSGRSSKSLSERWSWLERVADATIDTGAERTKTPSLRRRKKRYDKYFPEAFLAAASGEASMPQDSTVGGLTWNAVDSKVLCCKLVIRGHLFGTRDSVLIHCARRLVLDAWDDALEMRLFDKDSGKILECLQRYGLDFSALLSSNEAMDGDEDSIGGSSSSSSSDSSTSSSSSSRSNGSSSVPRSESPVVIEIIASA